MSRTKILAASTLAALLPVTAVSAELSLPLTDSFLPDFPIGINDENPRWTVVDNNNDGYMYTWSNYNEKGMGNTIGYAECTGHYMHDSDDYLVSHPIRIEAGDVHLSFYYRATSAEEPEIFDVLFGKSDVDVQALPVIRTVDSVTNSDWKLLFIDINVPESGTYTLAIHSRSTSDGHMLRIDEFEMDYGRYQARPDMAAVTAAVPLHCDLLTAPSDLKFTVINNGAAAADGFDAAYSVNDGEWVNQHVSEKIESGQSFTVVFDQKADFSTPGSIYTVGFKAWGTEDMWEFNDGCAGTVRNVAPKNLPYEVNFAETDNTSLDLFWWPSDFGQQGWKLDYNSRYRPNINVSAPLVSGGLTLDKGDYKFLIKTEAGSWGWPENETCDFTLKMGKAGTDMSRWKTVVDCKGLYTEDASKEMEYRISVDEAAVYSFALSVDRNANKFYLDGISLNYTNADDVSVKYGCEWPMADMIPAKMLSEIAIPVTVTNSGRVPEEVTLQAEAGGQPVSEPVKVAVQVMESVTVNVPLTLGNVSAGDDIAFTVSAAIDAEDANPGDNSMDLKFTVSDEVLRRDNISDFTYPFLDGAPSEVKIGFGSAFHLTGTAVLSGVDLVLYRTEGDGIPFLMNIYKIGEGNIGRLLSSNSLERKSEAGVTRFALNPLLLEPGDYFFEIVQNYGTSVGLCCEKAEGAMYHTRSEWFLNPDLFNPDEVRTNEGINLGIRPVFANDAQAPAVNLQAVEFLAPRTENLMFKEEPVTVVYNSLGYEKLENVEFDCYIDGVKSATATIGTIEPYQLGIKVNFTVDLTAVGEHTLKVVPSVNGDSDTSDNDITMTVNSLPEVDRYTLDFESCYDFATRFNPSWYTVDGDGVPTNGIMVAGFGIWWPGCDESFGFVAFNPDETIPLAPGFFTGYNGKRFGASFFTSTGVPNDDWLISPPLQLGDKPVLKFRCKSQTDKYGMEEYYVLVSPEGSDKLEDFVPVGEKRFAPAEWEDVKVDLSEYAGKSPRVAIHCVSEDKFIFIIDDIAVEADDTDSLVETKESHATVLWDAQSGMLHATASADATVEHIDVFAVSGMNIAGFDTEGSSVSVKLGDLPSGTYICRVLLSDGSSSSVKIPVR